MVILILINMFDVVISFVIGFLLGESTGLFKKLHRLSKLIAAEREEVANLIYLR